MKKENNKDKSNNKLRLVGLVLVLSVILVIIIFNTVKLGFQAAYPMRYTEYVDTYAEKYDVDKALIYSLIETESGYDPMAVSSAGAKGLTQILPETFKWLQSKTEEELPEDALFEPETSIKYGVYLLDYLIDEFGTAETALAAYHAGIGKVHQWLADPRYSSDGKTLDKIPFDDTKDYVKKVIKTRDKYLKLYDIEVIMEAENNVKS